MICWYCRKDVVRIEQDHMPIPKRHEGELTVAACIECHHIKDRMNYEDWPLLFKANLLSHMMKTREGRIYLGWIIATLIDCGKPPPIVAEVYAIAKEAKMDAMRAAVDLLCEPRRNRVAPTKMRR